MISPIALLALLSATLSVAAPVSQPRDTAAVIFTRAAVKPVSCGPNDDNKRAWTAQSVQDALDGLEANMNKPNSQKPGAATGKGYPGNFTPSLATKEVQDALNAIEECKTGQDNKQYLEFPITSPAYTKGAPGPDRVVAIVTGTKPNFTNPIYCFSLTHRDQENNGFALCTEEA